MARHAIFIAIAFLCLTCAGAAQALTFPALTGRVVDDAGLLDATDRAALTASLADLEAKTTDQLVIVTVKSLQGTSIEDFGYQLGRNWQIGQKDKNNGALLIVAPGERAVRIEVGYGLEGTLTDAATKLIIENTILPRFKTGDFPGGIKRGTASIIQLLGGDTDGLQSAASQSSPSSDKRASSQTPVWPVILLVLGGIALLIFCATRGGAVCRGITQMLFLMLLFGGGGRSSQGGASFSGGGGSFGGGGASGSW
jgi:uncharacterized protein